ncbi:hypothetical protein [Myroides fluvii]|uniref:hypothetical protein n=1 Tax=Myroides fluvii TaxID=2572594 RepID=UPI00131C5728|nr:hypothetical protein [Myroides fluvii]
MNKQPTHYYIELSNVYVLKNNLQKEFSAYLKTLDRQLIKAEALENMKDVINQVVAQKNEANKRCNPIILTYTVFDPGVHRLEGFSQVTFDFKPAYLS